MKRIAIGLLAAACMIMLSGCMPLSVNLQRADQAVSLPVPDAGEAEPAIGDSLPSSSYYVSLYLVSSDQRALVPVSRAVTVGPGQSLATEALLALLSASGNADARSPFPAGTHLLNIERSGNAAVVNLSIEARNAENEQQIFWMHQSVADTLVGLDGIEYVNVMVADRSECPYDVPMGAQGEGGEDLAGAWAHLNADQELLGQKDGEMSPVERNAVLYYPSRDGKYIAPVVSTVSITGDDRITPLIEALFSAPEAGCLRSPFPANSSVLTARPEIVETEAGRHMARLAFDANLIAALERDGLNAWQTFASLTYTLTGFLPEVDGLIVLIGDGQLTRAERDGQELTFTGGEMSRASYPDAVCRLAVSYMSASDGGLLRLERPLDRLSAVSPRAILNELFMGPAAWETGASRVLPDGVTIDDILGIRIADGEATVNLSSNFYRCCQSLTAQQERNMIYAMVNSLTELQQVRAVRFQVEGETVDHLVSSLMLRGPLMRNPGLIR